MVFCLAVIFIATFCICAGVGLITGKEHEGDNNNHTYNNSVKAKPLLSMMHMTGKHGKSLLMRQSMSLSDRIQRIRDDDDDDDDDAGWCTVSPDFQPPFISPSGFFQPPAYQDTPHLFGTKEYLQTLASCLSKDLVNYCVPPFHSPLSLCTGLLEVGRK